MEDSSIPSSTQLAKPLDAWWTVLLVDPVATPFARLCARARWLSPTHLTALSLLLGLASAGLFWTGAHVVGAVVFEIRFLLDCTDGKLARLTGRTSRFGATLDKRGDEIVQTMNLMAITYPLWPAASVALVFAYPLANHLYESRRDQFATDGDLRRVDREGTSTVVSFFRARRMYEFPSSVDIEHLVLVVGPVVSLAYDPALAIAVAVAVAFFAAQSCRYFISMLRGARAADDTEN